MGTVGAYERGTNSSMKHQRRRELLALAAGSALAVGLTVIGPAPATGAPATSQTQHFTTVQQFGTPTGQTTNNSSCPGPVLNDYVYIDATGNGVQHQTVNGAGDSWFTTTFTGTGTVTFYPEASLSIDTGGNVTGIIGLPDMTVTGHLTEWFGFEANKQNQVAHGTVNFQGTVVGSGSPIRFHQVTQARWAVGTDPNGPPDYSFNNATC